MTLLISGTIAQNLGIIDGSYYVMSLTAHIPPLTKEYRPLLAYVLFVQMTLCNC
jgi:hypothetical protein